MAIFPTPPPAKYKIQWLFIVITAHGGTPVNILFLFRNVRNFDVRIQYTKCIQSEDKLGGNFFLMQTVLTRAWGAYYNGDKLYNCENIWLVHTTP